MILAVDVYYDDEHDWACAAGVVFEHWDDERPVEELTARLEVLAPYRSGQFYRRELPCILPIVLAARQRHEIDTVVIDGYVDLGERRPGLGRVLAAHLKGAVRVIGVAKTAYRGATPERVKRGSSERPLYVTCTHDAEEAGRWIARMHGEHRMPTLLARVDRLGRQDGALDISPS